MHSPRSDEPIYWLLFGAGGMVVGIVLPSVILVLLAAGISSPDVASGLLSFEHVRQLVSSFVHFRRNRLNCMARFPPYFPHLT